MSENDNKLVKLKAQAFDIKRQMEFLENNFRRVVSNIDDLERIKKTEMEESNGDEKK